jgi:hypothetical protein
MVKLNGLDENGDPGTFEDMVLKETKPESKAMDTFTVVPDSIDKEPGNPKVERTSEFTVIAPVPFTVATENM